MNITTRAMTAIFAATLFALMAGGQVPCEVAKGDHICVRVTLEFANGLDGDKELREHSGSVGAYHNDDSLEGTFRVAGAYRPGKGKWSQFAPPGGVEKWPSAGYGGRTAQQLEAACSAADGAQARPAPAIGDGWTECVKRQIAGPHLWNRNTQFCVRSDQLHLDGEDAMAGFTEEKSGLYCTEQFYRLRARPERRYDSIRPVIAGVRVHTRPENNSLALRPGRFSVAIPTRLRLADDNVVEQDKPITITPSLLGTTRGFDHGAGTSSVASPNTQAKEVGDDDSATLWIKNGETTVVREWTPESYASEQDEASWGAQCSALGGTFVKVSNRYFACQKYTLGWLFQLTRRIERMGSAVTIRADTGGPGWKSPRIKRSARVWRLDWDPATGMWYPLMRVSGGGDYRDFIDCSKGAAYVRHLRVDPSHPLAGRIGFDGNGADDQGRIDLCR